MKAATDFPFKSLIICPGFSGGSQLFFCFFFSPS